MKLTERDLKLIRDVALSQVMSRDQILSLGYFGSVTRLNTRLRALRSRSYLKVIDSLFSDAHLFMAGKRTNEAVGERVAKLLSGRHPTPRFIEHSLMVTNVRIALLRQGCTSWRFEVQLRHRFHWGKRAFEIRPDGLVYEAGKPVFLEVDLGNVSASKFAAKMQSYETFSLSGGAKRIYGCEPSILTVTTGPLRERHLRNVISPSNACPLRFTTFDQLGIELQGGLR